MHNPSQIEHFFVHTFALLRMFFNMLYMRLKRDNLHFSINRCVTRNYGFIGCSTGVLQQLDNLCSGRHSCKFDVSDPALVRTKPCPQDFSSYLEASYSCIKGKLKLFCLYTCQQVITV